MQSKVVESERQRSPSPSVSDADLVALVRGSSDFAFELYRQRRRSGENLFFSPFSISMAMAMIWAGARAETADEIEKAMRFRLPQKQLHRALSHLDHALAARAKAGKRGRFQLHLANAIWGQEGLELVDAYLNTLADNYGAGVRLLDFGSKPEAARIFINEWIEKQTRKRIRDLLPKGSIHDLTRLVLTNAIYFKASWASQFEKLVTRDGAFTLADGKRVRVPMMSQETHIPVAKNEDYAIAELPYEGDEIAMVLLLPPAGSLRHIEDSLSAAHLEELLSGISPREVRITMPRFRISSRMNLKGLLQAMGMQHAFSDVADFSGMSPKGGLEITDILHQAVVNVDETGTEAAAATAVAVGITAVVEAVELTLDRPFVFLIRDRKTGAILFAGRVVDPR